MVEKSSKQLGEVALAVAELIEKHNLNLWDGTSVLLGLCVIELAQKGMSLEEIMAAIEENVTSFFTANRGRIEAAVQNGLLQ